MHYAFILGLMCNTLTLFPEWTLHSGLPTSDTSRFVIQMCHKTMADGEKFSRFCRKSPPGLPSQKQNFPPGVHVDGGKHYSSLTTSTRSLVFVLYVLSRLGFGGYKKKQNCSHMCERVLGIRQQKKKKNPFRWPENRKNKAPFFSWTL